MKKFLLFLFPVCFLFSNVNGQISYGGLPYSFLKEGLIIDSVPQIKMPTVDVKQLLKEDSIESKSKLTPWRFGKALDVNLNLNNSGLWQTLPNGDRLWRLSVKSENAFSLNFIFDKFRLAAGSKFFIYSKDKSIVLGAFTEKNNRDDGSFSTTIVKGDEAIFEFYEPADVKGNSIIQLSKVIHGYKNIFNKISHIMNNLQRTKNNELKYYGDAGSCNINVNCPVGLPWANEKRAVAMIIASNNTRICTGALLNNVRQDCTPFFLTAKHCTDDGDDPTKWFFMFNYESPGCANAEGPTNFTLSGSTFLASDTASDFALLKLLDAPPVYYNVYYAGWSAIDTTADSCVAIHHPHGDIKKITFEYDTLISTDWYSGVPNSHWTIDKYAKGTTEPGSSGCPLINKYHRIIGQLHGGDASCDNSDGTDDNYGKFSYSWDKGSSPAYRLKDWLDPDNTGILILNGKDCNHPTYSLDAGIIGIDSLYTGNICKSYINPQIILQNYGYNTLHSADIYYGIDDSVISHYHWKGNLRYMNLVQLNLSALYFTIGKHTFFAYVTNPNDSTDQNLNNDTLKISFSSIIGSNVVITLHTDLYPNETSWTLKDSANNIIYSNPQLSPNTLYNTITCLANGCYKFTIYDSYGDGMCGKDTGFVKITLNDTILGYIDGCKFSNSDSINFCIKYHPVKPVKEVFLIYPNPNSAKEPLHIKYVSARNEAAECTIYNILGQLIGKFSIENKNTTPVYLNNLRKGLYFLSLKDYHGTRVKKFIIL